MSRETRGELVVGAKDLHCLPGRKKEVRLRIPGADSYKNCSLEKVLAPDWVTAQGKMRYYLREGSTSRWPTVDFEAMIEVLDKAPVDGEAEVVFVFSNPAHTEKLIVRTSYWSHVWLVWLRPILISGLIGGLIGAIVGGFRSQLSLAEKST
jgi:hypothetical protein